MTDVAEKKRRPLRCWLGSHRWVNHGSRWDRDYRCSRCDRRVKPCSNCGDQHDPHAFTICTVTRGGWA